MIQGYVTARSLAAETRAVEGGWVAADGFVLPYRHPALEAFSFFSGERRAFVVREKAPGRSPHARTDVRIRDDEFDARLADARNWPLDFVIVTIQAGVGRPVTLCCGQWSVAPVYLLETGEGVRFHWDASRLYPFLRKPLDAARLAFALCHLDLPYSHQTLFADLFRLTERSEADWTPGKKLTITYPRPLPHSLARKLVVGADVLKAFDELLQAVIRRWNPDGESVYCELSGGLDSATVAVAASRASNGGGIGTYGLIMPGAIGEAQLARRTEVAVACGARDTPVAALPLAPFGAGRRGPGDGMVPWGEYYHEAFRALLGKVRDDGGVTIFRGIGGDEISQPQPFEAEDQSPREVGGFNAHVPSFLTAAGLSAATAFRKALELAPPGMADQSVYDAMSASSVVYLRSGIWPRYPYATPELVEFCRRLPAEWRLKRTLQRRYLRQMGLSERVWNPQLPETFVPVLEHGLRRAGRPYLDTLFGQSALADLGLVDRSSLMSSYRRFCDSGDGGESEYLLTVACIEATIQAMQAPITGTTAIPPVK